MSSNSFFTEVINLRDINDGYRDYQIELENMLEIENNNVDIQGLERPPSPATSEHLPAESELEENQLGISDLVVDGNERSSIYSSASPGSTNRSSTRNVSTETSSAESEYSSRTTSNFDFILFNEFPKELRDMIWKASANIPSTVHMVVTHGGFNFVPPYPEVPAVLLVNKESRANALQFFEQVRASPFYRPSGWIVNRYVEGIGPRPGLATSGVNVHNTLRNPVTGRYIDCHPPPNQPPYSTGVLLHLQGSYGYTAQPPLEGNPIVPGLQEAFSERMGQHWARVTPKFWVNFYSDVFKLTFPGYNNPYPYFQLQPMCYPSSQWVNSRPLPAKPSTKPRLGAFPWTHNEPLPQLWNKVKHLALGLSLDRTHFQNAQGFPVWSQPALNDYCANFVASIRTKFPNLNKLSFVVALDPTVPQLHGRPCDRMELRPLRSAPLVPSSGPTWQGRASLEKLELDIKSFYWNEFGATGVHDNIDLVVEVPESVVRGRN